MRCRHWATGSSGSRVKKNACLCVFVLDRSTGCRYDRGIVNTHTRKAKTCQIKLFKSAKLTAFLLSAITIAFGITKLHAEPRKAFGSPRCETASRTRKKTSVEASPNFLATSKPFGRKANFQWLQSYRLRSVSK